LSEVKNALDQLSNTGAKSSDRPGLSRDARDRRLEGLWDLPKKYESQIAELSASLAEKTAQLNERGGEANKARVGAAELELADLLKQKFEAQREAERLSAAVDQHKGEAGKAVKQFEAD